MSTKEKDMVPEPTFWVLIGSLVTALFAGISWCVQKRCRRTHFAMNSGCFECSADSDVLRATIRAVIHAERQERESQLGPERLSEEGVFHLDSPVRLEKGSKV